MATAEELVPFVQSAQILEMDKKIFELEKQSQGPMENSGSGMYVCMYCMYVCMYVHVCMYVCMYVYMYMNV